MKKASGLEQAIRYTEMKLPANYCRQAAVY
jgi:hypothetical protein